MFIYEDNLYVYSEGWNNYYPKIQAILIVS